MQRILEIFKKRCPSFPEHNVRFRAMTDFIEFSYIIFKPQPGFTLDTFVGAYIVLSLVACAPLGISPLRNAGGRPEGASRTFLTVGA